MGSDVVRLNNFRSHQATKHTAMIYSFPNTFKMNDIEPFAWLKEMLSKIPDSKMTQLHCLLPAKNNLINTNSNW